jgi:hypothetical protein
VTGFPTAWLRLHCKITTGSTTATEAEGENPLEDANLVPADIKSHMKQSSSKSGSKSSASVSSNGKREADGSGSGAGDEAEDREEMEGEEDYINIYQFNSYYVSLLVV